MVSISCVQFGRMRLVIIGGGSWGTALAKVFAHAGHDVALLVRDPRIAAEINGDHTNTTYLPGVLLPKSIRALYGGIASIANAHYNLIFLAIPAQYMRSYIESFLVDNRLECIYDTPIISLAKGIEHDSGLRMTEVIAEVISAKIRAKYIGVLSGPNLAREVAADMPSSAVLALQSDIDDCTLSVANALVRDLSTPNFILMPSNDVIGCEIAGAAKNIIALACGLTVGLGYGDNSQAAIMTAGFREITSLAVSLGGVADTLLSPAGLGDLAATCYSQLSRNRTYGQLLGSRSITDIEIVLNSDQTVEAIPTTAALVDLAVRHRVEVPIMKLVAKILLGQITPIDAVHAMVVSSTQI